MELYIDLVKGSMNTSKLVKRPIQVKGKNGKVFTRMQWVDPVTGQPVDKHAKIESENSNKKTQKEHIDDHVKSMSREDKYHHIAKHGITWKKNDHAAIDHKNAVGALKEHFYKNPHLAGAEHLDQDAKSTPEGDDKVNDWVSKYSKDRKKLYDLMHHAGITPDNVDPTSVKEYGPKPDGNGSAPIRHMRTLMAFKKHLRENPDKMDEYSNHPDFGMDNGPKSDAKLAEKPKPAPKAKSKAQEGDNSISGILKSMSSTDLYALAKSQGIADRDPRTMPEYGPKPSGNGSAPIRHMRVMMALKSAIEKDPSILNLGENGGLSDTEQNRLNSLDEGGKLKKKVEDFLDEAGKDLKLKWADEHKDHDHMKNRIKSDNENVANMHKVSALKKILMDNPSLMDKGSMKDDHDREQLRNLRIGNKMMEKILREVVGLKGIGDAKSEERGVEWSFGVASFARINEEDDGSMVLSVVDCGKDGEEWNEHQFPLEQIKKYIDDLKAGKETKEVKSVEIPLHKKPIPDMWKALNDNFDANYTPEVGQELQKSISEAWMASGRANGLQALAVHSDGHVATLKSIIKKLGGETRGTSIVTDSDAWKKIVYTHMIDKTKTKDANEYIQKWKGGMFGTSMTDTWLLHESAKHWDPMERAKARKEIVKSNLKIPDGNGADRSDRHVKLVDHIHKSLEFVPFDLMTDVIAQGCGFDFSGKEDAGCYFNPNTNMIHMDPAYFHDSSLMDSSHPMEHTPSEINHGAYTSHASIFGDVSAHEFAHAMDYHMSGMGMGTEKFCNWTDHKYAGSSPMIVKDSYAKAVERSNPNKYVGATKNGNVPYVFHKDEWMSAYEGRIYHPDYTDARNARTVVAKAPNGKDHTDIGWNTHTTMRGLEHWSENTSRYAVGLQMYQKWQKQTGDTDTKMGDWAKQMHTDFMNKGYGDASNEGSVHMGGGTPKLLKSYLAGGKRAQKDYPVESAGYLYHKMSQNHPELTEAMHNIYGRGDFLGSNSPSMKESYEQGDYTRKSELIIYI